MPRILLVSLLLAGCADKAAQDEAARLTQRVADLERSNQRLQADNDALKSKVTRMEEDEARARKAALFSSLGYGEGKKLVATLKTSMGDLRCVLRPEQAPETVLNFVQLARGQKEWTDPKGEKTTRPLYDGTIFHRVIPEFMIQGGDPEGTGRGGPGYTFADEVGSETVFDHAGILAMANRGPNTNGSQFFVTEGTPTHLNGKHTIFGDCADVEMVKKIARVDRDRSDKPLKDVVLKTVAISVE